MSGRFSLLSLVVTYLTSSKVGSITAVEEDPRFAFVVKAVRNPILQETSSRFLVFLKWRGLCKASEWRGHHLE